MQLDWCEPLEFAARYAGEENLVLLHSSLPHPQHGQRSILALGLEQAAHGDWQAIAAALASSESNDWHQRWFGFLSYEMGWPSKLPPAGISLPTAWFGRFRSVFVFDHTDQTLTRFGGDPSPKPNPQSPKPVITSLRSNMDKARYLQAVQQTLEQIAAGEFYQANITRKFFGQFAETPDSFALFTRLCEISPASYSAYLRIGGISILSSSPECFLTIDENGRVESRPIKGTAPIETDPALLAASSKDRAENLMIVDLMRNDLSLHCEAGSVQTQKLFEVTSYATLHHMDSTITGQRAAGHFSLDVIRGCFPPGSMTGAPKKAVMQWCEQAEGQQRGIYSGAIGWLAANGAADLSVVIRTLLIEKNRFEFQVGGGIVADSSPEKEWQETLTKARGITNCLNINNKDLEAI
mgnify:CR=1 FL=1